MFPESTSSSQCFVCCEQSDGLHFGAVACRACAAFFRRTVQFDRKHICMHENQCLIVSNVRNMCRYCRFQKCLDIGMKESLVQKRRDQLGRREIHQPSCRKVSKRGHPVLDNLLKAYKELEERRKKVHCREDLQAPKAICFQELREVYSREMGSVYNFLCTAFPEYSSLTPDVKRAMFKNFFLPFTLFECFYFGYINNKPDVMIIPSGDFIDLTNLETYFNEDHENYSKKETNLILSKCFDYIKSGMTASLFSEKVELFEYLFLVSMIFWEPTIEHNSSDTLEKRLEMRRVLVSDILFHYQTAKKYDDPALRLGKIMSFLPMIQRATHRYHEYLEIRNLMNIYTLPRNLHDMFTPNSC